MAIPLFVLCIGSVFVGYLTKDLFIGLGTPFWNNAIFIAPENLVMIDAEFIPTYIKWLPVVVSLSGAMLSMIVFHFFKDFLFEICTKPFGRSVYIFLNRRWLFDRLQNDLDVELSKSTNKNNEYIKATRDVTKAHNFIALTWVLGIPKIIKIPINGINISHDKIKSNIINLVLR